MTTPSSTSNIIRFSSVSAQVDLSRHFSPQEIAEIQQIIILPRNVIGHALINQYINCLRTILNVSRMVAESKNLIAQLNEQIARLNELGRQSDERARQGYAEMREKVMKVMAEAIGSREEACCPGFLGSNYYIALAVIALLGAVLGALITVFLHPHCIGHYFVGAGIGLLALSTIFLVATSKKTWGIAS